MLYLYHYLDYRVGESDGEKRRALNKIQNSESRLSWIHVIVEDEKYFFEAIGQIYTVQATLNNNTSIIFPDSFSDGQNVL